MIIQKGQGFCVVWCRLPLKVGHRLRSQKFKIDLECFPPVVTAPAQRIASMPRPWRRHGPSSSTLAQGSQPGPKGPSFGSPAAAWIQAPRSPGAGGRGSAAAPVEQFGVQAGPGGGQVRGSDSSAPSAG